MGLGKVGVQYTDYYNDPEFNIRLSPYADSSLIYTYLPAAMRSWV